LKNEQEKRQTKKMLDERALEEIRETLEGISKQV